MKSAKVIDKEKYISSLNKRLKMERHDVESFKKAELYNSAAFCQVKIKFYEAELYQIERGNYDRED